MDEENRYYHTSITKEKGNMSIRNNRATRNKIGNQSNTDYSIKTNSAR